MACAYVMSIEREEDAFKAFMQDFPGNAVMLVDTYDTVTGVRRAIAAARATRVPLAGCGWTPAICWISRARRGHCSTRR